MHLIEQHVFTVDASTLHGVMQVGQLDLCSGPIPILNPCLYMSFKASIISMLSHKIKQGILLDGTPFLCLALCEPLLEKLLRCGSQICSSDHATKSQPIALHSPWTHKIESSLTQNKRLLQGYVSRCTSG